MGRIERACAAENAGDAAEGQLRWKTVYIRGWRKACIGKQFALSRPSRELRIEGFEKSKVGVLRRVNGQKLFQLTVD